MEVLDREKIANAVAQQVLTPECRAKGHVVVRVSRRKGYDIRASQLPMDYYFRRRIISPEEYNAGNKLYRDFYLSGQTAGMSMNLDAIGSGERKFTDAQMQARESWRKAVDAINGTIAKTMVINVCCYGKWLKDTEYLHYKTSQWAMARFHEAMDDLIKHYDLTRNSQ